MSFLVVSVPSDKETETNCIYVSPADFQRVSGAGGTVVIREFPFTVRAHPSIADNTVGMNSVQRRLLALSTAGGSSVNITRLDAQVPDAAELLLSIEHISPSKKGGTIDCQAVSQYVKAQFGGQCFRAGQQFALVMNTEVRLITTVSRLTPDPAMGKASSAAPDMCFLGMNTAIIIQAVERCQITLTNVSDKQMDSQQSQLVQNFNLMDLGIGGLRSEFAQVFRRAFASRMVPMSLVKKLGIKHVRGILLFGPPGTGKTLIARKIGEILNCHEPKIVNGPEVFNKFVGGTEENIRKLFADAEAEQASKGDQSQLHLIIFDEFDAICKQRGAVRDSTGVNDNVVNQLLSKIDGVNSLNNVLLIGMTNRLDMLDEAVLRPGRFEVHIEIGLPDEPGREEIFTIHTKNMRENNMMSGNVDLAELAKRTKNYSGAEIEGVVRSATSNAFNRHIDLDNPGEVKDADHIQVTMNDFALALEEVTPAFGQAKKECADLKRGGIANWGAEFAKFHELLIPFLRSLKSTNVTLNARTVLLHGPHGCGKTALAAYIAEQSEYPYLKVISSQDMVGYGELQRVNIIRKAFDDAYKSPASCILLDDLERIIDFSQLGGIYSNTLLQALLSLVKRPPPEGKKLLIVATTSLFDTIEALELADGFSIRFTPPLVPMDALTVPALERLYEAMKFTLPHDPKARELCMNVESLKAEASRTGNLGAGMKLTIKTVVALLEERIGMAGSTV